MNSKTKNIIGWVLTCLLAALMLWSAFGKFFPKPEMAKMVAGFGLSLETMKIVGMLEVLSILLFIIPRTGVAGTLLLAAYFGGAIATHLEHGQPVMAPVIVEIVVWIAAALRFPELTTRLFGKRA